jgi:hypothetical protein
MASAAAPFSERSAGSGLPTCRLTAGGAAGARSAADTTRRGMGASRKLPPAKPAGAARLYRLRNPRQNLRHRAGAGSGSRPPGYATPSPTSTIRASTPMCRFGSVDRFSNSTAAPAAGRSAIPLDPTSSSAAPARSKPSPTAPRTGRAPSRRTRLCGPGALPNRPAGKRDERSKNGSSIETECCAGCESGPRECSPGAGSRNANAGAHAPGRHRLHAWRQRPDQDW